MTAPQHFLYFLPLPQLQGSFLPGFMLAGTLRSAPGHVKLRPSSASVSKIDMALYLTVLLAILNNIGLKGSKMLVALYALDLGASPFAIGVLVSMYAIFPLVLAVHAGGVSDRFGPRRPMMLGSFGVATGLMLPVLFPALPTLYFA